MVGLSVVTVGSRRPGRGRLRVVCIRKCSVALGSAVGKYSVAFGSSWERSGVLPYISFVRGGGPLRALLGVSGGSCDVCTGMYTSLHK